ncbi:MAG: XrtA/PEP-CTERM system TPR-repeat protein PrsT [Pseudomonadales bacterium]
MNPRPASLPGVALLALIVLLLAACDRATALDHLDSARTYYERGEYQTAVIELRNALQKDPDLAEARYLLGQSYLIQGQYADALNEFERALDLGIDHDELMAGLLGTKVVLGRYQEVLGELESREDLSPSLAMVLADAHLAANEIDKARSIYLQHTDLAAANRELGTIAWFEGNLDEAERLLDRAVTIDPADRESWLTRAEFALATGNLSEASEAFARARALPGGELSAGLGLARTAIAGGRFDEALTETEAVTAIAPNYFPARYVEALARYALDDVDGAESALQQVQRVVPDHPPTLYLMGAIKFRQGQLGQAEDNLQRFLARQPRNESAAKLLAMLRLQKEDLDGAGQVLEPLVDTAQDPQLLALFGTIRLRQGQSSAAALALERAVALAPDAAAFRNQLALSLLSAGEEERAVLELETAVAIDGEQFQSDYLMALLSLKNRNFETADAAAQRLIDKSPDQPMGYNLQGASRIGLDDEAGARRAFEQALAVSPEFLPAAQNLARLDEAAADVAGAMDRYQAVLAVAPENTAARIALADLAARHGDLSKARTELEQVVAADPGSLPARLGLARLALSEGRLAEARSEIDAALSAAPEAPDPLLLAAELALRTGDVEGARQSAENLQRLIDDGRRETELLYQTARIQRQAGLLDPARRNLNQALGAGSGNDPRLLTEQVRVAIAAGDAKAARQALGRLPAQSGPAVEVSRLEAQLLQLEGRDDDAMAIYRQLSDSGDRESLVRLVSLQLGRGEVEDSLALMDRWLADNEADTGVQILRADALMRLSNREQAIAQYEALLTQDNPVVLNNLAWLYMELGDERAVATAERAMSLAPGNGDIADTLGWILVRFGEPERAIPHIELSVARKPNDATVRYHLAVAYLEAGRTADGRRALEAALGMGAFAERVEAERRLATLGGV